jgi:nitrogen-specific signal transduction histidine kinase
MISYNISYQNPEQLQNEIRQLAVTASADILVQIFTSICARERILALCALVRKLLPGAKIIGATTSGEIINREIVNNSTVLSISVFESTTVKAAFFTCREAEKDSFQLGVDIARALISADTKALILFSDGLSTNGEDIIKGVESVNNKVIVAGGRAADNGYMHETLVFTATEITDRGIVGVALDSNKLLVRNFQTMCWEPIGKKMTVTHAVKNRVYTLDHVSIRDIYEKYLGKEIAADLPKSATEFPFLLYRQGVKVARVVFGANEDDSLSYIGNIHSGEKVQFSYGSTDIMLKQRDAIYHKILANPVESIFIYSCTARRVFFHKKIEAEISPFSKITSIAGFFSYGEFYHRRNRNELLTLTTAFLVLAESKSMKRPVFHFKHKNRLDSFAENKQGLIVDVLSHLANTVTFELEEKNKDLLSKNLEYKKLLGDYNRKNLELVRSNKRLIEQQNMIVQMERLTTLGQLIGGIAHNLQTPLMSSSGGILEVKKNTTYLKELTKYLPDDKRDESDAILDEMIVWEDQIKKYLIYMSDVIYTVRGQIMLTRHPDSSFTISELVNKIEILMDNEARRQKCRLDFMIHLSKQQSLNGDINNLVQVMNNLILNAIGSYAGMGGKIEIVIRSQKPYIEFSVRDRGMGIPKQVSKKIFKEMVTTKGKNGSGLGLYISYLIIKTQFKGDIYFKNNMGKGTTFFILIPVKSIPERKSIANETKKNNHSG